MGEVTAEAVIWDSKAETNPPTFPQPFLDTREVKWDLDVNRLPCSSIETATPPAQSPQPKRKPAPSSHQQRLVSWALGVGTLLRTATWYFYLICERAVPKDFCNSVKSNVQVSW